MKGVAVVTLCIAAVVAIQTEPVLAQCAMCRRALQSPEGQQMVAAYRAGILVLLAAPLAVFVTVATLATRRFLRR